MSKWDKPRELSDTEYAICPKGGISVLLPNMADIPEEFKATRGYGEVAQKWVQVVEDWFFRGMKVESVVMKDGIDWKIAKKHLGCILHSYEPKHEHKVAGVAYLLSLWIEDIEYEVDKGEKV